MLEEKKEEGERESEREGTRSQGVRGEGGVGGGAGEERGGGLRCGSEERWVCSTSEGRRSCSHNFSLIKTTCVKRQAGRRLWGGRSEGK